jgi:hypothetical protein
MESLRSMNYCLKTAPASSPSFQLLMERMRSMNYWINTAPANSPILKSIIDLSVERILNTKEIKGEHIIHHLTGPGVFTDGIEKYLTEHNNPIFANKKNYYRYPHNMIKVFNYNNFHNNIVKHLFAGQNSDGWFHERYHKIII